MAKDDRPSTVSNSVEEYQRPKRSKRQAFRAADVPGKFLADLEALASRKR